MAVVSFAAGLAKLCDAAEKLSLHWNDVRESWDDDIARSIGEKQIEPLLQQLRESAEATARLRDVVTRAERECGDTGREE